MDITQLYETIFKRRSIRTYKNQPLDAATLADITTSMAQLVPLYPEIRTEVKILYPMKVKLGKSPHYVVFFSERKPGYHENAGFMLQQVDLFLSARGLGTCWLGMVQGKSQMKKASTLKYVIALAVGYTNEPLHRNRMDQFDRKPKNLICNVMGGEDLIEPIRLAPSAMNRQPWWFTGTPEKIDVFCQKTNVVLNLFLGPLDRISIGIALYHLWCTALHLSKKIEVIQRSTPTGSAPSDFYFITSLKIA